MGSLTSRDDIIESGDTFSGACLTVVIARCLPGVVDVNVALSESCDFDQPVRLGSADRGAELVNVACRDAWVDVDVARSAYKRIPINNVGDYSHTRAKCHWDSEGEREQEVE